MLEVEHITKRFPGVIALSDVSMQLHAGKVNAIVGENGAGKSTLMKILSGVYNDFEGRIIHRGKQVTFSGIRDAESHGISIIHQELNLIPHLSIQENIFLGREIRNRWGLLNEGAMKNKTTTLLQRLKLDLAPETLIVDLKIGQQQLVEIAKALLTDAEVIIMDEPTSAISDREVDVLFEVIQDLKREGKTIVYISHKLDELFRIADRYIVMRDGCCIESGDVMGVTADGLIQKMVGRKIETGTRIRKGTGERREMLSVKDLSLKHSTKSDDILKNISFCIESGEIVGLFGLMGAGRTELLEALFGLHSDRCEAVISVDGQLIEIESPADAIHAGIALVPEDRKRDGLVLDLDVRTNISLTTLDQLQRGIVIDSKKEAALSEKYIAELKIKSSSERQPVRDLSGGNQQKIVISKWLASKPKVLLLDEPTRGIDVGSKYEIYNLIRLLSESGIAVMVVSSELPEILAISDRILVMSEGTLTAEISIEGASEKEILRAAIPKSA
jgi:ribose transport system ATP-binding protein